MVPPDWIEQSHSMMLTATPTPVWPLWVISGRTDKKPTELGDDVFRNAVREVLLIWIARHVGEGQHGDGGFA